MYKKHQLKRQLFYEIIPLLDKEFDEKQLEEYRNYKASYNYPPTETSYISRLSKNIQRLSNEKKEKFKDSACL